MLLRFERWGQTGILSFCENTKNCEPNETNEQVSEEVPSVPRSRTIALVNCLAVKWRQTRLQIITRVLRSL